MSYHSGTLQEFNNWHETAKSLESIDESGKIGFIKNNAAPDNMRTYSYSTAYEHPEISGQYLWAFGNYPIEEKTVITYAEAVSLGWFESEYV